MGTGSVVAEAVRPATRACRPWDHAARTGIPHPRTIGPFGTAALAMGGSNQSLFIIGALIASQGSAAVPLLIVGLLLSWAAAPGWIELVLMWPNRVGGIAATCAEAFRPYSPVLATLTGVCYWWGWIPTCGLTALLSATAIHAWYVPAVPVPALATALVLLFTAINLCGVHWATRLAVPIATVSALLALLSGLIPVLDGRVDWQRATTFHLMSPFSGPFGGLTGALAGLYLVGFAAPAFEAATCHVGETVDPTRNVPRAVAASGLMALLYFGVLPVVWLGTLGPVPLAGNLMHSLAPTFAPLLGRAARAALWFMMFNMFHGTLQPLAGASRTLMQLAEDGLLPCVLALRSRRDVPWVATALTAGVAILFLLTGDPTWIIAAANLAYLIGIGLPSVAVWLLRRDAPHLPRPYRAPRGTVALGLVAAAGWGVATVLGFEQFGLPTVLAGLALSFSGTLLYALRRWSDRRREPARALPFRRSLHLKLTGAMLLVLTLDGTGYLVAVTALSERQTARITVLEDIFVAVALLTLGVGLILPGRVARAAGEVAGAAERLATGTLADLVRAMQALGAGDLEAAHAPVDITPLAVYTRDEVGMMAASFNVMQDELADAARALDGAREGLRRTRDELQRSNADLERRVEERTAALQTARAAAVAHANRLAAIFEAITDGIVVSDAEGRILQANAAGRALLDLDVASADEHTGEPAHLLALRDEEGHPLPPDRWPSARIMRGEVLTGPATAEMITTVAGHDVQLSVGGAPVRDGDGTIAGAVVVLRDMTERWRLARRTHDALHALLDMAETLVGVAEEPAAGSGHAGVDGAVAKRLAAMTRSMLGCRRVTITTVDEQSDVLHRIAAVGLSKEQERQWRARAQTLSLAHLFNDPAELARVRAGETVIVDVSGRTHQDRPADYGARALLAAPLHSGHRFIGLLAIDHGMHKHVYTNDEIALAGAAARLVAVVIERERLLRERAEAQATELALREANGRMDEFLSIASHELRTPLTTVKGYVQLAQVRLQRHADGAPSGSTDATAQLAASTCDLLARTDAHVRRLTRLIDDLLDVSRIHANRLELRPEPCNLCAIVRDVVQDQRHIHPGRTIALAEGSLGEGSLGEDAPPVPIVADPDRIRQVVTNYLSNALKYAPPDRPIEVGLGVDAEMARVWVRDQGPGLSPADQARVWERFYRVGSGEHHDGSHVGLGLGLHISRTIVERHAGQVGMESAPGRGATFWFTLPLAPAAVAAAV